MQWIFCPDCRRKLAKWDGNGRLEICCPRCKRIVKMAGKAPVAALNGAAELKRAQG